jgi:hypothetical protein
MWPLMVAAGVYMICKGIQEGIDENSGKNQKKLPPHRGNDSIKRLPHSEYDILDNDDWGDDYNGR